MELCKVVAGSSTGARLLTPNTGPGRGISRCALCPSTDARKECSALMFRIGSQYKGQEVLYELEVLC